MCTNSKRSLIITLHEIYGLNDHIRHINEVFNNEGFEVFSPNLLDREPFQYDQEDSAYHYFMNEIGFDKSINDVKNVLDYNRKKYDRIYIIGFSVGATIAWLCSEYKVDGIIGFYGSRIRDYVEIEPKCSTLLFFSRNEKSFDVLDLEQSLNYKKKLTIEIIDADHGFMNPFYKRYDPKEYMKCLEKSMSFLRQLEGNTSIR